MDFPGKEKEKEKRGLFFESGLDLRRPLPHSLGRNPSVTGRQTL